MAGKKGRSGRRTVREGEARRAIIQQSWNLIQEFFNNKTIPIQEKIEIAARIAVKDMPSSPLVDQSQHYHITYAHRNKDLPVRGEKQFTESAESNATENSGLG